MTSGSFLEEAVKLFEWADQGATELTDPWLK